MRGQSPALKVVVHFEKQLSEQRVPRAPPVGLYTSLLARKNAIQVDVARPSWPWFLHGLEARATVNCSLLADLCRYQWAPPVLFGAGFVTRTRTAARCQTFRRPVV